jgi:hypothetical protein
MLDVSIQPKSVFTIKEYIPGDFTTIEEVVSPVDQKYFKPSVAESLTLSQGQIGIGLSVVIVASGLE